MKKKHNLAFHLVMLLFIMLATLLVFYKALVHLRNQIDDIKINSVYRVKQIGEDYEMLLASNEELINRTLENEFDHLKSKFISSAQDNWLEVDETALKHGIDLIILTDLKGSVLTATEMKLKGENLNDIVPGFADMIRKLDEDKGLFIDRVGLLTDAQTLYKTAWFVSEAHNRVLIYAVDMAKYLSETNSDSFAGYLLGGYFANLSSSIMMVSQIDLCFRQGNLFYSYLNNNIAQKIDNRQIYGSIESQIINSYQSVIIPLQLQKSSGLNQVLLNVTFDNEMIRQISLNLLFRALLGFVILSLVIYLIVYFFFKSLQHDREELMLLIIEAIRHKEFKPSMFEKDTFKPQIEEGIIELADKYQTEQKVDDSALQELALEKDKTDLLNQNLAAAQEKIKILTDELSELRELTERMQRNDQVTGLPNREVMIEYLDYESARADREKILFSIVILKIKNLKSLSTSYGHNFCDYILNKAASKLRGLLRKQDRLGRWDHDQFLMILPVTQADGTRNLIAKLQQLIANTEFLNNNDKIALELLFGGMVYKPGMKTEYCLRQIEVAVQEADHSGNNVIIE